jgi:hypothetical protein
MPKKSSQTKSSLEIDMKTFIATTLTLALLAGTAIAQNAPRSLPEGAMKPTNLNDLGSDMRERVSEAINGEVGDIETGDGGSEGLSLFSGDLNEDPNILEIKNIARELDSQRAIMIKVAELQQDLIEFAQTDAAAAYQSRIPSSNCLYALEQRFCDAMTGSFQQRTVVVREN